jgi:hypothetical protein
VTVSHRIVGYDAATDRQKFVLEIPANRMTAVKRIVNVNEDDPNAYDSYELSVAQAREIASAISPGKLPPNLAFFLECFGKRSTRKQANAPARRQVKLA